MVLCRRCAHNNNNTERGPISILKKWRLKSIKQHEPFVGTRRTTRRISFYLESEEEHKALEACAKKAEESACNEQAAVVECTSRKLCVSVGQKGCCNAIIKCIITRRIFTQRWRQQQQVNEQVNQQSAFGIY